MCQAVVLVSKLTRAVALLTERSKSIVSPVTLWALVR